MTQVKLVVEELNATTGANVNTRVIVPTKCKVQTNGTRATDTGEFTIPITGVIGQNDIVSYIQDVVDTQSLVSIYNFKHSARDEGGFDLDGDDGTFTADFAKETLNKFDDHYHIQFNAAGEEVTISHTERHNFESTFDIMIHYRTDTTHFAGNSNGQEQAMFSKWDSGGTGNGVMVGLQYDTINGWDVWAKVRTGGTDTELFTTSFLEVGNASPAFIRLCRDENDLVSLYLGDTLQDSATVPGSFDAASTDSIIGSDNGGTLDYSGDLYQLRIYDGCLSDTNAELVRTAKPQWTTMKLRARVWKIKENTSNKVISVRSDNQVLFKTEVSKINMSAAALPSPATSSRALNIFESSENSDDIMQDILAKIDSNIIFARGGGAGSAPIAKYIATGTLLKNLEILSVFNQNVFWFNARQVLILEDPQTCRLRYDHGLGYRITSTGKDDSTTVNDLEAVGRNATKTKVQTTGTGVTTFPTSESPLNVRIQENSGSTYLAEDITFTVDIEKKLVTFTPPLGGGVTATIFYEYEDSGNIISRKLGANTAGIGVYARRVIIPQLPDISNLNTFTSNFVTGTGVAREDINERYKVIAPLLVNSVRENIKPTVKNTIKSIDTTATIKSITYEYPSMRTTIEIGEHMFDSFDLRKRLVESDNSAADNTLKTKNI
jgi:hypothetical protein